MTPQTHRTIIHNPQLAMLCGSVVVLWFCGGGCGVPTNLQSMREEILKVDPTFQEVLEKRDELAQRIDLLKRELDLKRSQTEQQIAKLRRDLGELRKQVEQKTEKTKTLLKPDQARVDLAISMATEERQAKRSQRASLGRSISRLQKSLKQTNPPWPEAERRNMDADLQELLKETQRLDREIGVLNEHIRLLKIKRLLLRL